MHPAIELLVGVHILLLLAFIGVTSLLLMVTVVNRVRVRDVLLAWPNGRFFGLPIWSTLFLGTVLGFLGVTSIQAQPLYPMIFVGYMMGGMFWFAASVIMSCVHVTPHGIVMNVNRNGRAIAWSQIVDYFAFGDHRDGGFVFLYRDGSGFRRRLELHVPSSYRRQFIHVIRMNLDPRFEPAEQELAGPQTAED